jgi:hypothetical protein
MKKGLAIKANPLNLLEAATGVEPVNNGFADRCLSHLAMPPLWHERLTHQPSVFSGAGNGIRTRDRHVGNVELYQLSYSRIRSSILGS